MKTPESNRQNDKILTGLFFCFSSLSEQSKPSLAAGDERKE